ncbi:MAG: sigma 54-interacting transcriptional regulator [Polyangiaceae bacterium]
MSPALPPRYSPISRLGKGGGGEVWAVRDAVDGAEYALKTLAEGASESEVLALVREASTLSGLEGLGVPRVLRFGRLPEGRQPYLLRELVRGRSLAQWLDDNVAAPLALGAVLRAADQLTRLHRASLLHGDIKPGNIIVDAQGNATLVDLGLAAPWREHGQHAMGLTPGYAAPELFSGARLSVRSEVYSLGATLRDVLEVVGAQLNAEERSGIEGVVAHATAHEPSARFPSVDELASSLRRAAHIAAPIDVGMADAAWPISGVDTTITRLLSSIATLKPGGALVVRGRSGSGRTAIVRRLAWSLGVEGRDVAWIEASTGDVERAVDAELAGAKSSTAVVLIDDADRLPSSVLSLIREARNAGARLVITAQGVSIEKALDVSEVFVVPPLEAQVAANLVRRAIPSMSDAIVARVVSKAEGRPGKLRALVRKLDGKPLVTPNDVDRTLDAPASQPAPMDLNAAIRLLDQGRLNEASTILAATAVDRSLVACVARARLALGRGDLDTAQRELEAGRSEAEANPNTSEARSWKLYRARTLLRLGQFHPSIALVDELLDAVQLSEAAGRRDRPRREHLALEADALSCKGIAEAFLGQQEAAITTLETAVHKARLSKDRRVAALALGSLALAFQRHDRLSEAKRAYEEALEAAEDAGDAGAVANTRLNLASLATHGQGEIAEALTHLEAAVDMGRRAGREGTVLQALLNLANLDLYLGRISRAETTIATLVSQRERLSAGGGQLAQLGGLEAELAARKGDFARATALYETCAAAYEALGRNVDAAEARIEAVLVSSRALDDDADPTPLALSLEKAAKCLGDAPAHKAALALAQSALALRHHDEEGARKLLDDALNAARSGGQKEWIWRALESRSILELDQGRSLAARRDAEQAVDVLEEIASRLPRDLREVYWNDPRRASIRAVVHGDSAHGTSAGAPHGRRVSALTRGPATVTMPLPADDRLARILEINRELSAVHEQGQVLERVIEHAAALLQAERGYVLLASETGHLSVHAARSLATDQSHHEFSKSIAAKVLATGEPFVSVQARDDARMASHDSVHQLMLQSVACVPIQAPNGRSIGALYLETRLRRGSLFEKELSTLQAFADQAAIAIETARLLAEDARRRAELEHANTELARANAELQTARLKLEESLSHRTAQLEVTKRDLKDTRAVLRSHFGYQGLVGTSASMRKVYALIDRVKDTDVPILITGESGTGKEVIARAIHSGGPRARRPFTGVNCGAIPANLLESELFGHVKGAFTGAERDRKGLFRESDGGSILLDEIGEMPLKMQAGLLRVLQERVVRPIGGTREEPIDTLIIAATHRDLTAMIAENTFREDLYYRLRVVEVHVPPLRERPEDIPALIDHFLQIFAGRYRREKGSVSREALRRLMAFPWPGNVRQLENTLLNAWVLSESSELTADDFDLPTSRPSASRTTGPISSPTPTLPTTTQQDVPPMTQPPRATRYADHLAIEKERILQALEANGWNRVQAAKTLGIPRRTFYRRLKEFGIQ